MAIQNRRGQSADFVASKMVPGEFAVSQDNRKLYLCFTAGNVKEIAIAEDMANAIAEMNLAMEEWHDEVVEDTEDKVEDAEAWAQGTRGGTPVPSTDPTYQHNAKYYAENIVDNTLSIAGKAADAKKTGDEISDLKDDLEENGFSANAKTVLLACFANVAWTDGDGQSHYNNLYNALYNGDWDYVWNASSGTIPYGMTSLYYDFTTEPGAMYVKGISLALPTYSGDMIMSITAKTYARSSANDTLITLNSPQIIVKQSENSGMYKLIKLINNSALGGNSKNRIAVGINGTNTLINDFYSDQYNTFEIKSQSGLYDLKINGNTVPITQNQNSTQYGSDTGISGYDSSWSGYTEIFLKEIKIKLL